MTATAIFVGIDISGADVVVACRPDDTSLDNGNDPEGIAATVTRLRALAPTLVVLEATGGYETALVAAVVLPVVVANPRQVCDFANATGQLAKTAFPTDHRCVRAVDRAQPVLAHEARHPMLTTRFATLAQVEEHSAPQMPWLAANDARMSRNRCTSSCARFDSGCFSPAS